MICDNTPVISFFNMSHWWSDQVRKNGIPSSFIQVWMLPKYCVKPIPWAHRKHEVIFCGTMYPHRKTFFDKIKAEGVDVEIVPAGKEYAAYLDLLSNSKIAIRSELISWKCDLGQGPTVITHPNAQWQRDIECASRGCFSMRERDGEAELWNVDKIPTIVPFTDPRDAAAAIKMILSLDSDIVNMLTEKSIEIVKNGIGWKTVPDAIIALMNNSQNCTKIIE